MLIFEPQPVGSHAASSNSRVLIALQFELMLLSQARKARWNESQWVEMNFSDAHKIETIQVTSSGSRSSWRQRKTVTISSGLWEGSSRLRNCNFDATWSQYCHHTTVHSNGAIIIFSNFFNKPTDFLGVFTQLPIVFLNCIAFISTTLFTYLHQREPLHHGRRSCPCPCPGHTPPPPLWRPPCLAAHTVSWDLRPNKGPFAQTTSSCTYCFLKISTNLSIKVIKVGEGFSALHRKVFQLDMRYLSIDLLEKQILPEELSTVV